MVSCRIGILSRSAIIPTPDASPTSHNAPNMPPSVTSCIAVTPAFTATAASGTTEIYSLMAAAASTICSGIRVSSSSRFSSAMMEVPSRPAHFVMTRSSSGRSPPVETSLSFLTFPTPVTVITGRLTTSEISVWPPITSICRRLAASMISSIRS